MMRRITALLKWKKSVDILGGIQPIQSAPGQLLRQVADNNNLEAAFQWLIDNSQEYHHNNEVWDFRRQWPACKEHLAEQLRQGEYQFQTVSIVKVMNDDGSQCQREIVSPQDKLVVRAIAQVLQSALQAHLSTDCAHIKGNGGIKGSVAHTQIYVASHPRSHCMKSDILGYYTHVSHIMLMEQLHYLLPNEPALCRLIWGHLRRTTEWGGNYKEAKKGLPLGSALSPILGAIYLSPLDALFVGWKKGFYQRFMDDWVIIQSKRYDLRKTIKKVYAVLHTLGLRIAQDKTYIGRVCKGFDFLGFHCCPTGMSVSEVSLSRRDQKIARLYEQGASKKRVGAYLRRWLGWAGTGLLVSVVGCNMRDVYTYYEEPVYELCNKGGTGIIVIQDWLRYESGLGEYAKNAVNCGGLNKCIGVKEGTYDISVSLFSSYYYSAGNQSVEVEVAAGKIYNIHAEIYFKQMSWYVRATGGDACVKGSLRAIERWQQKN